MDETTETPIFEAVVVQQGWTPAWQHPRFDLDEFVKDSYLKAKAHAILMDCARRDREKREQE